MKTTREKQLWLAFNSQDQNNPNCIHDFDEFCEKHSIFNNGSFKQAKTYTQQELEEYAKQKQLELLDEIEKALSKRCHTAEWDDPSVWGDTILEEFDKKRERITSENNNGK